MEHIKELSPHQKTVMMASLTMMSALELLCLCCMCCGFGVWVFFFDGYDWLRKMLLNEGTGNTGGDLESGKDARMERFAQSHAFRMLSEEDRNDPTKLAMVKVIAARAMHNAAEDHEQQMQAALASGPSWLSRARERLTTLSSWQRSDRSIRPLEDASIKSV